MSSRSLRIAVIIPTFNSFNTLNDCLKSILLQSLKLAEIIVVDNASIDNTSKKIIAKFPTIKLVTLNKNTGVTGGRNAGIKNCNKNDYLFFVDHDMVLDKNCLKELIEVGESSKGYGVLTPKILYFNDRKRIWAAGTNINLWTGQVLFRGGKDEGQFEQLQEVQVAPAAILVKRKVLDKIKVFNEKYFATYEDTDFCFRAKKFGFQTIYVPQAIAYHQIETTKESERERLLSRSYYVSKNRILFMKDFGRNYFFFLLFSPVYLLYFIYMSIIAKDFKALLGFIKGYVAGLRSKDEK